MGFVEFPTMLYEDAMSDDPIRQPDEQARVSRLSTNNVPAVESPSEDSVVREYEQRYEEPRKVTARPRSYSTMNVSDEERLWAAIAHGSIWVTMLGGIFTIGFVIPASVFIPLAIYFMFRKRSDYVAFHALQAFVLQLIGTVGVLALAVVGGTAWIIGMIISLLAVFVLAGIVLVPLWAIVGIALALVVFFTPLAALLFGTIATVETYNRRDYRYPFIARWVDRQLAGGFLNAA
jgi:uncharacterized Tic20 family protein